MTFESLLTMSCVIYREAESDTEDEFGSKEITTSVVYSSVPCLLQDYEYSFRELEIPGTVAMVKKELFTPLLANIDIDYIVYVDSKYYRVARIRNAGGQDHHHEIVLTEKEVY